MKKKSVHIKKQTDQQIFELYSDIIEELRRRKIVRTSNNPVADYAEYLVAKRLRLKLLPNSNKSADAINERTGVKYQIKSRRVTQHNSSRQLGVIRDLKKAGFKYLIVVLFDDKFKVLDIYQIPKKLIKKYARYSQHQHGHILIIRGPILNDKLVKRL